MGSSTALAGASSGLGAGHLDLQGEDTESAPSDVAGDLFGERELHLHATLSALVDAALL